MRPLGVESKSLVKYVKDLSERARPEPEVKNQLAIDVICLDLL